MTDRWPDFAARVAARLEAGARQYGNGSFARPPAELVGEIEEEVLDVCAWSFILWCRLRRLHGKLVRVPAPAEAEGSNDVAPEGAQDESSADQALELEAPELLVVAQGSRGAAARCRQSGGDGE
jgi:hypothetical protein